MKREVDAIRVVQDGLRLRHGDRRARGGGQGQEGDQEDQRDQSSGHGQLLGGLDGRSLAPGGAQFRGPQVPPGHGCQVQDGIGHRPGTRAAQGMERLAGVLAPGGTEGHARCSQRPRRMPRDCLLTSPGNRAIVERQPTSQIRHRPLSSRVRHPHPVGLQTQPLEGLSRPCALQQRLGLAIPHSGLLGLARRPQTCRAARKGSALP